MNFLKVANLWSDNLPIFASIFEKSRLKNSSYDSVIFGTKIQILSFAEIYWHLLSFTKFCCDLLLILLSFVETSWYLLSFTKICWVLLSFTEFCWVLLNFAEFCWELLRYAEILLSFAEISWDYTLFENHPKCLIWIFQFCHFPPIFVISLAMLNETFSVTFKHRGLVNKNIYRFVLA